MDYYRLLEENLPGYEKERADRINNSTRELEEGERKQKIKDLRFRSEMTSFMESFFIENYPKYLLEECMKYSVQNPDKEMIGIIHVGIGQENGYLPGDYVGYGVGWAGEPRGLNIIFSKENDESKKKYEYVKGFLKKHKIQPQGGFVSLSQAYRDERKYPEMEPYFLCLPFENLITKGKEALKDIEVEKQKLREEATALGITLNEISAKKI